MLLDFWTYSCINCLRTLPHLESWYSAYHPYGLVIIGVHSPEFAFEHVASNVAAAIKRLGITYPVVQDNNFATWTNYSNQYWPADYLIDQQGRIRAYDTGEGGYTEMEAEHQAAPRGQPRSAAAVARLDADRGDDARVLSRLRPARRVALRRSAVAQRSGEELPAGLRVPLDSLSYSGTGKSRRAERSREARRPQASLPGRDVYLVLGGRARST